MSLIKNIKYNTAQINRIILPIIFKTVIFSFVFFTQLRRIWYSPLRYRNCQLRRICNPPQLSFWICNPTFVICSGAFIGHFFSLQKYTFFGTFASEKQKNNQIWYPVPSSIRRSLLRALVAVGHVGVICVVRWGIRVFFICFFLW